MLFCIEVGRCVNGNIPNFKVVKSIMNIMEYKQRIAITENLRTGKIPRKIIMFFRYPKSTTYNVAKRYEASKEFKQGSQQRRNTRGSGTRPKSPRVYFGKPKNFD